MAEAVIAAPEQERDEPRYRTAFHQLAEERAALHKDEVLRVNADAMLTITAMLGAWPAVRALRERIAYELPRFDLERFDRFQQYVCAFSHANTLYVSTGSEQAAFLRLCQAAIAKFNQLFADATALARRGLISDQPLARLKRGNGYRRVPLNLLTVVQLLRMNWGALEGKTAVTRAELDEAEVLAESVLRAIAESAHTPANVVATRDDRRRAFTHYYEPFPWTPSPYWSNIFMLAGTGTRWEIALPSGNYEVNITAGGWQSAHVQQKITAEGVVIVDAAGTDYGPWVGGTQTVTVSDGKLTEKNAAGASNNSICLIHITPL
jgi:hypothetical protein